MPLTIYSRLSPLLPFPISFSLTSVSTITQTHPFYGFDICIASSVFGTATADNDTSVDTHTRLVRVQSSRRQPSLSAVVVDQFENNPQPSPPTT